MSPASASRGARAWFCSWLALTACSATAPLPPPLWTAAEVAAAERCQAGDVTGCGEAGRSLLQQNRSRRDVERALVLLEGGCGSGDLLACTTLGGWYRLQEETTSQARARELLTRACTGGVADACAQLDPPVRSAPDPLDDLVPPGPCVQPHPVPQ